MGSHAAAIESLLEGSAGAAKKPGGILLHGLGAKLHRASDLSTQAERSASPLAPCIGIERLLEGGLPRGKFVELAGRRSSGRFSIGIAALASVTSTGEPAALVDLGEHLDPQAAAAAGVDLELLLWVRPRRVKQTLASAEMLLAAGFPLVVADLGLSPRGTRYVPDAAWLRLARAAQAQDAALLLLTPWRMSGIAADAVLTSDSSRPRWQGAGESPRLLTTLDSRLTLQKLARTTPGITTSVSLALLPLPTGAGGIGGSPPDDFSVGRDRRSRLAKRAADRGEGHLSPREKAVVRGTPSLLNPKSKTQNPKSTPAIHPAGLEIRDPRPQIRNLIGSQITNHKSPITNLP